MGQILVYPSTLPGEPLERHQVTGCTLEQWLHDHVDGYEPRDEPPISATVDGVVVPPEQWADTWLTSGRVVELRPQPKGGGLLIAAIIGAVVAVAATLLLKPSLPSQKNRSGARGSAIDEAVGEANRPRLGDVIPELAGRHKRFPDYLTQARRRFSAPKEQQLDMLMCVGQGEYDIDPDTILLGNTPINELSGAVNYQIYQPGQSVAGHRAHQNWYNAPEVGQSVGGSGLRLRSTRDLDSRWGGSPVIDRYEISGGIPPSGWSAGTLIDVKLKVEVTIGHDGTYNSFVLNSSYLNPITNKIIEITGFPGAGTILLEGISPNTFYHNYTNLPTGTHFCNVYYQGKSSFRCRIVSMSDGVATVVGQQDGSDISNWSGFPVASLVQVESISVASGVSYGIWTLPFVACPEGETTSTIEFDIFAPQGLGYVNDDGDIESRSRTIELQYRPVGGSTWTTVSKSITGRTRDQLGWSWIVNLNSSMRPEVRVRRVSSEDNDVQAMDRLEWYGLRCRLPAKTSYSGVTVIAMTITGSDTIASQTENKVSLIATRKLPTRSGGSWTALQATRDIVPWLAYIAKSVGYTDADLDLDEMDRLDAIWKGRGDRFDFVEADDSTVKESLNRALRAGMAELTIDAGRIKPVRDEPRTTFEHMYTPQNMLGPLQRSVQAPRPDDPDGIDVEYFDDTTWTAETVECRLPGDQGFRAEKLRIEGVTNRTRAWRVGMRERRRQKYRRWTYSFSTELDALNSRYMSFCALADDIPGYAQSALVEGVEVDGPDVHLLSSEPLEWQTGKSHVVAWRRPDGTLAGPFPAQPGDDERHVIAQMDEVPVIDYRREPPHLLFGTTDEWSFPVLITSINPRGFESVSVDAVNYDERIYADDNGTPN